MNFPYRLEARPTPSRTMQLAVPLVAAVLTLVIGFLIFTLVGQDPLRAMHGFFIEPLSNVNGWSELVLKASPLCLIALGLAVGYRANVWNIGAEGQMLLGGIVAGGIAIHLGDATGWWILPLMMIGGVIGGMVWAAIPALLKSRFNTNEILTSLMLTYVATQLLIYLVSGPWRDPRGHEFPDLGDVRRLGPIPPALCRLGLGVAEGHAYQCVRVPDGNRDSARVAVHAQELRGVPDERGRSRAARRALRRFLR